MGTWATCRVLRLLRLFMLFRRSTRFVIAVGCASCRVWAKAVSLQCHDASETRSHLHEGHFTDTTQDKDKPR